MNQVTPNIELQRYCTSFIRPKVSHIIWMKAQVIPRLVMVWLPTNQQLAELSGVSGRVVGSE